MTQLEVNMQMLETPLIILDTFLKAFIIATNHKLNSTILISKLTTSLQP